MRTHSFSAVLFSLLALNGSASAHAFLLKSEPAVGARAAAPKTLRLEFSEGVELRFSGVEVTNASGMPISVEHVRYSGNNRKVVLADLPALSPGSYRVKWHVVSVDTHRSEGDFTFAVAL